LYSVSINGRNGHYHRSQTGLRCPQMTIWAPGKMGAEYDQHQFNALMLPHMEAAYNLARWLTGNTDDASDVVQESYLRAIKFFSSYRGGAARAWLLTIVRNTSLNWLKQKRNQKVVPLPNAGDDDDSGGPELVDDKADPEFDLIQKQAAATMDQLIAALPVQYREVVILREIEEFSYKEIAEVTGMPIGTVMSRLARAKKAIQQHWHESAERRISK
jgi:RNA polymerase sigma-70 factor, ECF subfamily